MKESNHFEVTQFFQKQISGVFHGIQKYPRPYNVKKQENMTHNDKINQLKDT